MDARHLTATLSDHHKQELLTASALLLAPDLRLPESALDALAVQMRIEPPRPRDLPLLPPRAFRRFAPESVEAARVALQAPPPVSLIGREAELSRAARALCEGRAVYLAARGIGKTSFLRALAAESHLRAHFAHVWWLEQPLERERFVRLLALALDAPVALDAPPEGQLSILRSALGQAKALLLCDWASPADWLSALAPYAVGRGDPPPEAELIALDALPESVVLDYLAAQTRLAESERAQLAALIGGAPALLRLAAALLAEDDLTPSLLLDLLRAAPPERRYTALLSEAINSFPAEYRAICHALAATSAQCLPASLIAARFASPLAARRALSFLARRQLIALHPTPEGELCSVLFSLPPSLRSPESAPFEVAAPDFERLAQVEYLEDEREARAVWLQRQGIGLTEENRPEEARQAFEEALALRQSLNFSYGVAETLSGLGRLAYLNGEVSAAIAHLEAAAEILHELGDSAALETLRVALCRAYALAGRLEAALAIADEESVPAIDLAALHRARGEWEAALACYERALADESDEEAWLTAQVGRAETLLLADRRAEALRSAPTGSFAALWARALAAHRDGDFEGALAAHAALESVTPYAWRGTVARAKARALAAAGALREAALLVGAEGVWYEARQPYPAFARQRLSLALYAHFCLLLGDLDAARHAAQEARALRAERPDPEAEGIACCALGRLALRAGDLTGAIAAFEAALKALNALREDQARANLLHLLGDLHVQRGDLERAIASYRRALGFAASESLLTQLALAETLEAAGRLPEALEAGGEAIAALHPQRMTADLTILGFAYARQARRQTRAGRAERAQVLADQWLHSLAARLAEALAQPDPALNALAIGLSLRADFESAFAQRDPIELIDLAERAVQVAEERAAGSLAVWAARRDLAELYRRLGRGSEALEVLAPLLADARSETGESLTWRDIFLCAARACPPSQQKFNYYRAAREREPDPYARGLLSLEEARLYRRASEARAAASARLDDASLDAFFARLDLNDLQRATVAAYEGAVFDFKRAGDEKRLAEALLEAGEFCTRIGQHGKAIKALKGALRVFGRGAKPDPARLAQLYADLGTAQANVGRAAQAAESFRQALRLIDQFSAPSRYAAILTAFARAELRLRAYQSAATAYQEVLQFDQPPAERQQLLSELGKALRKLNQHEAAARAYEAALSIPEGDSARRAALERALAECYLALADYDSAQRHYERALAQAPSHLIGVLWGMLGDLQRRRPDLQAARDAYRQAIAHLNWRRLPARTIAVERALGEVYLALDQPDQALPHLERAFKLEKWRKRKIPANLIDLAQLIATAHERRGDLRRATAYQHSALVYQDEQRDPEAALATLSELQRLYAQLAQHSEVLRVCAEALRLEEIVARPNPERLSQTYLAMGRAQAALHRLDHAQQSLQQALRSAANPEAERALAEVRARIARHEQALSAATQSRALLERARLPDLYSLVFVIALQLQHSLPLGRREEVRAYRADLTQLLRARRHELTFAADDPTAQALLALLRGEEAAEARLAAAEYRAALDLLRRAAQPNAALLSVLEYLLESASA